MARTKKKIQGVATIDVALVVLRTGSEDSGFEYAIDTSNKVGVEPQTETQEAIKLTKLGRLLAQKPPRTTITGTQITLTDNVFDFTLAKILQGGTISGSGDEVTYEPPAAGSDEKGEVFELDTYSAQYDASGQIVKYEKTTYPNCQGTPFGVGSEDDVFRLPEYVINSMPKTGQAPCKYAYVKTLPDFSSADIATQGVEGNAIEKPVDNSEMGLSTTGTRVVSK